MINARMMYLRPGNVFLDFEIVKVSEGLDGGRIVERAEGTGEVLLGCLESASPEEKERWDQPQHPVSHSIVQAGSPKAKPGWVLKRDGRTYRINGVDSCGELGVAVVYYVEERRDSGV